MEHFHEKYKEIYETEKDLLEILKQFFYIGTLMSLKSKVQENNQKSFHFFIAKENNSSLSISYQDLLTKSIFQRKLQKWLVSCPTNSKESVSEKLKKFVQHDVFKIPPPVWYGLQNDIKFFHT
jgi:hypothetical protein